MFSFVVVVFIIIIIIFFFFIVGLIRPVRVSFVKIKWFVVCHLRSFFFLSLHINRSNPLFVSFAASASTCPAAPTVSAFARAALLSLFLYRVFGVIGTGFTAGPAFLPQEPFFEVRSMCLWREILFWHGAKVTEAGVRKW